MHAHTAMYCPVTHNCPLGRKMKISIVIHHHHLIVLSHTYRHAQIPESKQHLQHLATQSFDLGSHPSHSEKKNVTVICLHSCIVCSPKQTSQGAWAFWKKKHQKNKLYKVSTCCTCCCNFIVYTHAPLSSSLALSYLHGTPLFFLCFYVCVCVRAYLCARECIECISMLGIWWLSELITQASYDWLCHTNWLEHTQWDTHNFYWNMTAH